MKEYRKFLNKVLEGNNQTYNIYIQVEDTNKLKTLSSLLVRLNMKINFLAKNYSVIGFTGKLDPQSLQGILGEVFLIYFHRSGSPNVKEIIKRRKSMHYSTYKITDIKGISILKKVYNEYDYQKLLKILGI